MVKFISEKISDTVTRIHGITNEQMYLVEGKEKAVLIDTGCGVGSLRSYIETLTDKSITVLITHGHLDHAPGAQEFNSVYMNHRDIDVYKVHCQIDLRKSYMSPFPAFVDVVEDDFIPAKPDKNFIDLKEGDIFDLGGVNIEIFECAGHTKGSVVMLLREERTLITGDSCNQCTFLFGDESVGLSTYEKNLKKLKEKMEGKFDRTYLSHGSSTVSAKMLDGVIQFCEDIKNGQVDNIPFEMLGFKGLIAKKLTATYERTDGGIGNIVYNPERILE